MSERMSDDRTNSIATEVWFVDVAACSDVVGSWDKKVNALDVDTKIRLARIKSDDERRTRTTVHCALRTLIERIKGPSWRGRPLVYSENGRPSLPGLGLSLSLSHTQMTGSAPGQGAGLIGFAANDQVGVDIEACDRPVKMKPERKHAIIAGAASLSGLSKGETDEMTFISAWVRLEAYAKATGVGLAPLLTQAMAHLRDPDREQSAVKAQHQTDPLAIFSLDVDPNFVAAAAVQQPCAPPKLCQFPTNARDLNSLLGHR